MVYGKYVEELNKYHIQYLFLSENDFYNQQTRKSDKIRKKFRGLVRKKREVYLEFSWRFNQHAAYIESWEES